MIVILNLPLFHTRSSRINYRYQYMIETHNLLLSIHDRDTQFIVINA
jgi:hypothetical protein